MPWTDGQVETRHFFHLHQWGTFPIAPSKDQDYSVLETRICHKGIWGNALHPNQPDGAVPQITTIPRICFHHLVVEVSSQQDPTAHSYC